MNRDAIYNLCNAVIIQACTDYVSGQYSRKALETFFHSSWYSMLVRESIDPDLLIEHLRERLIQNLIDKELNKHGQRRIHKEHAQLHNGMR